MINMNRLRGLRRRITDDSGAEVVEFAIVVPILLAFITAFISFGFVLMSQITLTQAAREGARYAAICKTNTTCLADVNQKIKDHAPGITIQDANIDVTNCIQSGNTSATVVITYQWSVGIPPFGSTGLTLHGKASTPCGG
jgi:Flp pilus assembly protein TadG